MGEERPSEVHGGGGEGSAANAEEESDDDAQDVLGAVTEGAEVVGSDGLLGFPVPQRHVVAVDRVTEEEDLGGGGERLFLHLGFWVEVADLGEDGDESRG